MLNEEQAKQALMVWTIFLICLVLIMGLVFLNSCTISFQNIDTHGTATDLVDQNQAADPNISPDISIPFTH